MKKLIIFVSLIALAACTKTAVEPPAETYFSKVKRYKDNRKPGVDTVWTLHLFNQIMIDSFSRYDGKIYNETSTLVEVGVLWHK